ncbi:MAG TPA: hypothetical protein VNY05_39685 [Candidatus Acidoferrales bacterium]|jgi:4-hydroxy-2-oxoheptanedioate aldolase|nr:hypothetical protein [Candidatus Acidoferrales bacterium]
MSIWTKADAWPLNPNGELLLGLQLEDKYALTNAEQNAKIPGIAFADWGPGDMALSLGIHGPGCGGPGPANVGGAPRFLPRTKPTRSFS